MPSIGTTAALVITGTPNRPVSFELHADADNTDTILYSTKDVTVADNFGELQAGQSIIVNNFVGSLYIKAESGTQTWGLPFELITPALVVKT